MSGTYIRHHNRHRLPSPKALLYIQQHIELYPPTAFDMIILWLRSSSLTTPCAAFCQFTFILSMLEGEELQVEEEVLGQEGETLLQVEEAAVALPSTL
jgi:hypothetical protein